MCLCAVCCGVAGPPLRDRERSCCRQPALSTRGKAVQPPRVYWNLDRYTGKQVSPTGRVQGPSRELETDSRNYERYFAVAIRIRALSLLLLPLSNSGFVIRDS